MPEENYIKRSGDRREGHLLRTLPAFKRITPFIQKRRSDAECALTDTIEVSAVEEWLRSKRNEGWADLSFTHLIAAAYIRTVSMRPGINRFVAGRHIFARKDIQVILNVKRGPSVGATETCIKVPFAPSDTVFDVYRRLSSISDEVKANVTISEPERFANALMRFPRFALRWTMRILKTLDYFDLLPQSWLNFSPFHGSVTLVDLGTFGVGAAKIHLSDFGTVPCAISFGARRKAQELEGSVGVERHYVDYSVSIDGRIADSYYFASALKCLKYFLKNPQLLELPPEKVEDDIN